MAAEGVKVPFYDWASAMMAPPEPGDDPAHPTVLLMFSKSEPGSDEKPEPGLVFAVCGRCLMEGIEQSIHDGPPAL